MKEKLKTPGRVRELQRKLYLKSKKEKSFRFYLLYDKVYRWDILNEAWRRVRKNQGAAGIDGETIEAIEKDGEERFLDNIKAELRGKTYKPTAVKRVWISKSNGKQRPLGIPTVKDRVVQMAVKIVIEPIFEADFEDCSYGFRPGRNAHQALAEVKKYLNWGMVGVVDADMKDFFNNIPHDKLMKAVARRIVDKWILKLIRMWLKSGVMEDGNIRNNTTGTPQGGVISPLLANIYLHELDTHWKKGGEAERKGMNARIVRYCDDVMIFTSGDVRKALAELEMKLRELELPLNYEKTRTLIATQEDFDYLGFNIRKVWNRGRTKMFPLVIPSRKAVSSIKARIRDMTVRHPNKLGEVVKNLNRAIQGWENYFRVGNSRKIFDKIRYYTMIKVRRFIRKKQGMSGYGWKEITSKYLYGNLGLLYNYRVAANKA